MIDMFFYVCSIYMKMPPREVCYTKAWIPVMALPKISEWISDWPSEHGQQSSRSSELQSLTICLRHKQVGNMSSNAILITDCVAAKDFLQPVTKSGIV